LRAVKKTAKNDVPNRNKASVAVIGASGYAGEELVRLLLHHPFTNLVAVTSRQFAGKAMAEVFPGFSCRENVSDTGQWWKLDLGQYWHDCRRHSVFYE
jgi:Semialdehyde dehydrogenase, NAD binding domain